MEGFGKLQALQARRDELAASTPSGPRVLEVLTGRTKAEAWDAEETDGRREMLSRDLPVPLVLGPGRRGRRGFDPARLLDLELDALPGAEDVGEGGPAGVDRRHGAMTL